jgi:hypothetical protein
LLDKIYKGNTGGRKSKVRPRDVIEDLKKIGDQRLENKGA